MEIDSKEGRQPTGGALLSQASPSKTSGELVWSHASCPPAGKALHEEWLWREAPRDITCLHLGPDTYQHMLSSPEQSPWAQRSWYLPLEVSCAHSESLEGSAQVVTRAQAQETCRNSLCWSQCALGDCFHLSGLVCFSEVSFLL